MSSSRVIGLKDVFGNTSDPRHFLEFQTHARTLQFLSDPVEQALNVRILVGEPGVGKTALLLRLLQQVQSTVLTTRLFWTQLGRSEFLHYFLQQLGVPRPSPSPFAWLNRAKEDRSYLLAEYLKTDARLDSLRSDPRFAELVRKIGLPQ